MDKDTATGLHRRLLENLQNHTTDMAASEISIPATVFTDPTIFARERQHLFRNTPQPIAFSGELSEPGSYLALQVMDVPVLLTRTEDGVLRAHINACSHRGAAVAAGSGTARSLVCPFHGWAYNLDGSLRGRPEDASFSTARDDCALTPLAVTEEYGVIVVALHPELSQERVIHSLQDIGEELAAFDFGSYRPVARRQFTVAANWKLVNDLSLESYHFKTLHRDSVAQMLSSNAVVDTFGNHSRWAFPLTTIKRLADIAQSEWPTTLQGSCTHTLYPGVMLITNALGAQMIRAEPGSVPGESRVSYTGVYRTPGDPEQAREAYEFGGEVFAKEDLPMAEECQRGIEANGRDLPLGRNEPLLQFWHRMWTEALD